MESTNLIFEWFNIWMPFEYRFGIWMVRLGNQMVVWIPDMSDTYIRISPYSKILTTPTIFFSICPRRPQFGLRRKLCRSAVRYMPSNFENGKNSRVSEEKENGAKSKRGAISGKSRSGGRGAGRKKDTRQKVKSSRPTSRLIDSSGDEDEVS